MNYQKTISFNTKDEETGKKTINAIIDLINSISVESLEELAKLSKEKPGWVAKAKPFLQQYKDQL